jgi:hypothetical protein
MANQQMGRHYQRTSCGIMRRHNNSIKTVLVLDEVWQNRWTAMPASCEMKKKRVNKNRAKCRSNKKKKEQTKHQHPNPRQSRRQIIKNGVTLEKNVKQSAFFVCHGPAAFGVFDVQGSDHSRHVSPKQPLDPSHLHAYHGAHQPIYARHKASFVHSFHRKTTQWAWTRGTTPNCGQCTGRAPRGCNFWTLLTMMMH